MLAIVGALALLIGLIIAPSSTSVAAQSTEATTAASFCRDYLIVGVKGSGETSEYGTIVGQAVSEAERKLSPMSHRSLAVDYTAAPVSVLIADLALAFRGDSDLDYYNSISTGVTRLQQILGESLLNCPDEQWVLIGYSQGALVIDQVLSHSYPASRIAGVLQIANPGHRKDRPVENAGTASPGSGLNEWTRALPGAYLLFDLPATRTTRILELCNAMDLVCDTENLMSVYGLSPDPAGLATIAGVAAAGIDIHTSSYTRQQIQDAVHTMWAGSNTSITGNVLDGGANWKRFGDVTVTVYRADGGGGIGEEFASALTDSQGNYAISNLPIGAYRVLFTPPSGSGYRARWNTGVLDVADTPTMRLARGSWHVLNITLGSPLLTGHISNVADDSDAAGVQIDAYWRLGDGDDYRWQGRAVTAADGTYALGDLPEGTLKLRFSASPGTNYTTTWGGLHTIEEGWPGITAWIASLDPDDLHPFAFNSEMPHSGYDVAIASGAAVSGHITGTSGHPISKARVDAYRPDGEYAGSGEADYRGRYEITSLPPGEYRLQYIVTGAYSTYESELWLGGALHPHDSQAIEVLDREPLIGVDQVLGAGATIAGTMTWNEMLWGDGVSEPRLYRLDPGRGVYELWRNDPSSVMYWDDSRKVTLLDYWFWNLPSGTYKIEFVDSGTYWDESLTLSNATEIVLDPGASRYEIDKEPDDRFASVLDPVVSGSTAVGGTLTATIGTWSPKPTVVTYQWMRNTTPIQGATESTYSPTAADVGEQIWVSVTAKRLGYELTTRTSEPIIVANTLTAATPTIGGTSAVGQTLTAIPGNWTAGTKFTYQWLRDGKAISGATKSTYEIAVADAGKKVTVKVTGTKSGHTTTSKTSAAKLVPLRTLKTATPTFSGAVTVGQKLTAIPGTWTAGTRFTYQWLRDGKAINKATAATYTVTASDAGKTVSVKVTGTLAGYNTAPKTSAVKPVPLQMLMTKIPTIAGTVKVGQTLSAKPGAWTFDTAFKYQWLRGGKAISGATKSSYKLSAADAGTKVTVKVTGTKTGYTTASKTSAAKSIPLQTLVTKTPTIAGTVKVGQTLSAKPGAWTSGTAFKYQWLRDGKAISGGTKSTYKLVAADAGKKIAVKVTGTKAGYRSVETTSKATVLVKK